MPYVYADGCLRVVLVLSRDGNRWGVPKGRLKPGVGKKKVAAQEAWEEAGLRGRIYPNRFVDVIWVQRSTPLTLRLYPFQVDSLSKSYPEKKCRKRRLLQLEKAKQLIANDAFDEAFKMIEGGLEP